jgi:hypothetical protein
MLQNVQRGALPIKLRQELLTLDPGRCIILYETTEVQMRTSNERAVRCDGCGKGFARRERDGIAPYVKGASVLCSNGSGLPLTGCESLLAQPLPDFELMTEDEFYALPPQWLRLLSADLMGKPTTTTAAGSLRRLRARAFRALDVLRGGALRDKGDASEREPGTYLLSAHVAAWQRARVDPEVALRHQKSQVTQVVNRLSSEALSTAAAVDVVAAAGVPLPLADFAQDRLDARRQLLATRAGIQVTRLREYVANMSVSEAKAAVTAATGQARLGERILQDAGLLVSLDLCQTAGELVQLRSRQRVLARPPTGAAFQGLVKSCRKCGHAPGLHKCCSACGQAANGMDEITEIFGWRKMKRGGEDLYVPQPQCRGCR